MRSLFPVVFAGCVLLSTGVSAPVRAAGFDCSKASTQVEKIICADPELSALDDRLNKAYKKFLPLQSPADKKDVESFQRDWLKERNQCKDKECVKKLDDERIEAYEYPFTKEGQKEAQEKAKLEKRLAKRIALHKRLQWSDDCEEDFEDFITSSYATDDDQKNLGIAIYPLDGKTRLATVKCSSATYQDNFIVMLYEEDAKGPGRPLTFKYYDRDPSGKVEVRETKDGSGQVEFDPKKKTLSVLSLAKGTGECGSLTVYGFEGGKAHVLSARAQACFDDGRTSTEVEPEQWPLVQKP